jgi:hypothetical protein
VANVGKDPTCFKTSRPLSGQHWRAKRPGALRTHHSPRAIVANPTGINTSSPSEANVGTSNSRQRQQTSRAIQWPTLAEIPLVLKRVAPSVANVGTPGAPGRFALTIPQGPLLPTQLVSIPVHPRGPTLARATGASASNLPRTQWPTLARQAPRGASHSPFPKGHCCQPNWYQYQFTLGGQRWREQLAPAPANLTRDQWPTLARQVPRGASHSPFPKGHCCQSNWYQYQFNTSSSSVANVGTSNSRQRQQTSRAIQRPTLAEIPVVLKQVAPGQRWQSRLALDSWTAIP